MAIVGAGIAGLASAFWLKETGWRVALIDQKGPLGGGSGAAGAFLSPRLGKGGVLQRISNEAYRFALDFYAQTAPDAFFQKGLLRLPKNHEDGQKFLTYKPYLDLPYEELGSAAWGHIAPDSMRWGGFYFPHAAFVDPKGVANRLLEGVDRYTFKATPLYRNHCWSLGAIQSKRVILCTGASKVPFAIPYLSIGALWGERVDMGTKDQWSISLHQKVSVSAVINGVVRIGATHVRNDPDNEPQRIHRLIANACSLVPALKEAQVLRIFSGFRASVNDHLPVVGGVADPSAIAHLSSATLRALKPEDRSIVKIPDLYLLNGLGGRGFVFAPLMARWLHDHLLHAQPIPSIVSPDRFLLRWARRARPH